MIVSSRKMLRTAAKCAILVCLAFVAAASTTRAEESCNLSLLYDYIRPPGEDFDDNPWIISGKGAQCSPRGVLKTDPDCELVYEPQHGAPPYFNCKNGLSGRWGNRCRELFEGLQSKRTQDLPKHHPARETWLAPIDAEGMDKLLPPTELSLEDFLRAVERNYIDDYPRTFTRIEPMVRWTNPPFRLATQTLFYTTMKGKQRAAVTGEAALGCLRLHFITGQLRRAQERPRNA